MILSECESCRDYYNATIDSIAEYASDREEMECFVQLDMVLHLWAVRDSAAVFQDLKLAEYYPMLQELLNTLGRKEAVGIREQIAKLDAADDENEVEAFRQYRLPDAFRPLVFTGDYWLNLISKLEASEDITALLTFVEKAINYSLWQSAYCAVFAWQYAIRNYGEPGVCSDRVISKQYWEYRQQEDTLKHYRYVTDKVQCLEKLQHDQCPLKKYKYRENLFMDLIKHRVPVSAAAKMSYLISTGRELTLEMRTTLLSLGYNEQSIEDLQTIEYLNCKAHLITQMLFPERLID